MSNSDEDENFDFELDGDNDGDEIENDTAGGKECTGRWTREEHQLFVKGLELYGKGWKKIASLIKTRTVVQIRTHAQKYFLKLSKARQSGDMVNGLGAYGFRKRRKRRYNDNPNTLAPILLPFLKISGNVDRLDPSDIEDGIYNFLSANLESDPPTSSSSSAQTEEDSPILSKPKESLSSQVVAVKEEETTDKSSPKKATKSKTLIAPLWYRKGLGIEVLLKEAEQLDWTEDLVKMRDLPRQIAVSLSETSLRSCSESNDDINREMKIRRRSSESLESLMKAEEESSPKKKSSGPTTTPEDHHLDVFFESNYF